MIDNTSKENKDIDTDADVEGCEEREHSISRKCSCHGCNNKAELFLEIVRSPVSGYYCSSCAIDIKFHGIAVEGVDYHSNATCG